MTEHKKQTFQKTEVEGSLEKPVVIDANNIHEGIDKENEYLEERFGEEGKDWKRDHQSMMAVDGKAYEKFRLLFPDGDTTEIYFDLTPCFRE